MRDAKILILLAFFGCDDAAEAGGDAGGACVQGDLVAQCPPASNPVLGAQAEASCTSAVGGVVEDAEGQATAQCYGVGTCRVMCQFQVPCRCGVASVSRDGVVCASCEGAASCGNGVCEGGESPDNCSVDCGAVCNAGERRCDGDVLQECSLQGRFDTLPCPQGEVCQIIEGSAQCARDPDIIVGGDAGVGDAGRPADGRIIPGDGTWPAIAGAAAPPFPAAPRVTDLPLDANLGSAMALAGGDIWRWRLLGDGYEGLRGPGTVRLDAAARVVFRLPGEYPAATLETFCEAYLRCWGGPGPEVCPEPFARFEQEPDGLWRRDCLTALGADNCSIFTELTNDCWPTPLHPHPEGELLDPLAFATAAGRLVGFSADRTRLVWMDGAGTRRTHAPLGEFTFSQGDGTLALSADGQVVAATAQRGPDQIIVVWNVAGEPRATLARSVGSYGRLALSPDGQVLAVTVHGSGEPDVEGTVSVWNLAEEQRIFSIRPVEGDGPPGQRFLAFSADGQRLALDVLSRTTAEIWRLGREPEKQQELSLGETIAVGAFGLDGVTLALGGESTRQVSLWDATTGQRRQTLPATDATVRDFDFGSDRLLITYGDRRAGVILRLMGP